MNSSIEAAFPGARPDVIKLIGEKIDRARLRGLAGLRLSGQKAGKPFVMEASTVWAGGAEDFKAFREELTERIRRLVASSVLSALVVAVVCAQAVSLLSTPFRYTGAGDVSLLWGGLNVLTEAAGVILTWLFAAIYLNGTFETFGYLRRDVARGYPEGFDYAIQQSVCSIGFTDTDVHIVREDRRYSNESIETFVVSLADVHSIDLREVEGERLCLTVDSYESRYDVVTPEAEGRTPMKEFEKELLATWEAARPARRGIEEVI